ncbi:MAG: hypothetical protein NC098_01080 [Lachnoclostridium sp.]|nr:hypothetical protein [Lachnoclostridium sp.]
MKRLISILFAVMLLMTGASTASAQFRSRQTGINHSAAPSWSDYKTTFSDGRRFDGQAYKIGNILQ